MTALRMIYDVDLMYFRVNGIALYLIDFGDDQDFESLRESSTPLDTRGLLAWVYLSGIHYCYTWLGPIWRRSKKATRRSSRLGLL